ncbi:hypothetical protein FHR90_002142 [Endobacter medicaginis]|uniref:Protein kinase domain-containing protein n=3 Tax=Endobacter medicaginis TaxID=1181271 RepID=A0A839V4A2_9PROT|nr:hypothetical protein [Endobacter medicaginis]MBB3174301.1 hypothetical protein [Endobacter medicaginis]MCX5476183.1 hypothetical protein [Endobacter medicaginis]
MSQAAEDPAELVIDERFVVATRRPAPSIGGVDAVEVTHRGGSGRFVALRVGNGVPPRGRAAAFTGAGAGLIAPAAQHVSAAASWFVVGQPASPALGAQTAPWSEAQIITHLIRPVAACLVTLQAQGLTHRAIRPDNVFGGADQPAVLGPCWTSSAASGQDARAESPWVAVCPPQARGEGTIADDVYALGALALALHLGHQPMPGLPDSVIIERKLEFGSFGAMTADERIVPGLADLLRSMLADDPDQRPAAATLADLAVRRERRGVRRVAARALRPLEIGECAAWNLPMLVLAIGRSPHDGVRLLRSGAVSQWLRRAMESPAIAARLDELINAAPDADHDGADSLLALRAAVILDPKAPLLWEGRFLWPDAMGAILYAAVLSRDTAAIESVRRALRADAIGRWGHATGRPASQVDLGGWLQRARSWRGEGVADPILRLFYTLNPRLPCLSPVLEVLRIVSPTEMIAAIEAGLADGRLPVDAGRGWIDGHVAAFLAARDDVAALRSDVDAARHVAGGADLALLAGLQARHRGVACPQLARTLLPPLRETLQGRPGRTRRAAIIAEVEQHAARGDLPRMMSAMADKRRVQLDTAAQDAARERVAELRRKLELLRDGRAGFAARAQRLAGEIGIGTGLLALAATAFVVFIT